MIFGFFLLTIRFIILKQETLVESVEQKNVLNVINCNIFVEKGRYIFDGAIDS